MKIGVDEVGYGCWAGPVFACALYFMRESDVQFFDSKKLSEKRRKELFEVLKGCAFWQIGVGSVEEINQHGLAHAHKLAILRSLDGMQGDIFIDGRKPKYLECTAVVKGDQKVQEIAAASIVAKVTRDELMKELALEFPNYGFEKHKGYGTQQHIKAMKIYGFSSIHRTIYNLDKYLK